MNLRYVALPGAHSTDTRRQLGEERRDRHNQRAIAVNEPIRLKQISRRLETTPPRHHQPGQIPRHIPIAGHKQRT
jgi:hypothetical protein